MPGIDGSQRFPFVNLEKALERAQALYTNDPRGGDMAVPTAFECWEYSPKSSGGFQTISALKSYGLLSDEGSDAGRKVRLSKGAMDFFRDERDEVRQKHLRKFALEPSLLASLWEQWGAQPPSDVVARSHLKVDRGLSEQSARSLLNIYKDNLVFANLKGDGKVQELESAKDRQEPPPLKVVIGDYVRWKSHSFDASDSPRRVTWVSDDHQFLRVHGNPTGIPMSELAMAEAPTLDRPETQRDQRNADDKPQEHKEHISVLQTGKRLQITADVDISGVTKLKALLELYEGVLKLLAKDGTS